MSEAQFNAAMARLDPTDRALIALLIERLYVAQRRRRSS